MSATANLAQSHIKSVLNDTAVDVSRTGTSAAPTSAREAYVLKFGFGPKSRYLRRYLDSGIEKTADLHLAQLFHSYDMATRTAELLNARVIKILTNFDGSNPRLALLHNTEFSPLKASLRVCQMQEEKEAHEKDENHEAPKPKADHYDRQPNRQDHERSEVIPGAEVHVPNMYFGRPLPTSVKETHYKIAVQNGGGRYRGIMPPFRDKRGNLVEAVILFASPETGSCLGLPASQLTQRNVHKQIEESNAKFAPFCERAATFVLRNFNRKSTGLRVLVRGEAEREEVTA